MKFGRVKKQHGRIHGLDEVLQRIVKECEAVTRIVPGRISVRRGTAGRCLKLQYPTTAGLKCLYSAAGTVQEVFLICSDSEQAVAWLHASGLIDSG